MTTETFRGVVQNGTVVLPAEGRLPDGTEVLVTPLAFALGSPAAVVAAVNAPPHVPTEWVDELEQLIAEGRRPPLRQDLFGDSSERKAE